MTSKPGAERGSATILLLGGVLVAGAVCALWVSGVRAGLARQRAETAADLAALAAARANVGTGLSAALANPCAAAGDIATRNRARLTSCSIIGEDARVTVTVAQPVFARASAKAGPG